MAQWITQAMKYAEMSAMAYHIIHEVMRQGEADGKYDWEIRGSKDALQHAHDHLEFAMDADVDDEDERIEHFEHGITRFAMAYYLWKQERLAENE